MNYIYIYQNKRYKWPNIVGSQFRQHVGDTSKLLSSVAVIPEYSGGHVQIHAAASEFPLNCLVFHVGNDK